MNFFDPEVAFELNERYDNKCFFCQHPESKVSQEGDFDGKKYQCPICGNYSISGSVLAGVRSKQSRDFYKKLASVAATLKLRRQDGYVVASFSDPTKKTFTFQNLLKERGDIDFTPVTPDIDLIPQVHLTLQGYEYIRKMQLGRGSGTHAFVAMSFKKSKRLDGFKKAVTNAVKLAGYRCIIINQYQHNDYIMDSIFNQISESKFVIADFTCFPQKKEDKNVVESGICGGVYFEAGFAIGKGKDLIATCFDDTMSREHRHFDISQINTIFWNVKSCSSKGIGSLVHMLYNRIIHTIGPGPIVVPPDIEAEYRDIISLVEDDFDYRNSPC